MATISNNRDGLVWIVGGGQHDDDNKNDNISDVMCTT